MKYATFIERISKSREGIKPNNVYMERHHIIPKCLGGTNDIDNLIYLYPREHLIAHKMLYKEHPENTKLAYALNMMVMNLRGLRNISKKYLKNARENWYKAMNGENDPRVKPVICLETKQIWKSARLCAKEINGNYRNVSQVCRGEKRTHIGLHFEFYNSELHTNEYIEKELKAKIKQDKLAKIPSKETIEKCRLAKTGKLRYDMRGSNNHNARKVINLDTKEIFSTLKSASESIGRNINTVKDCCKGRQKTAGGYRWSYYEELAV